MQRETQAMPWGGKSPEWGSYEASLCLGKNVPILEELPVVIEVSYQKFKRV